MKKGKRNKLRVEEDSKYVEYQIESDASVKNDNRRRTYVDWTEYIEASWNEGIVTKAKDKK
ncbi:hypothetical protein COJ17_29305 [Bacillus thuringiensis]|uniref:hypothetical protein n=1 Tax=Bacillus thuringiensis TaxID=1428 RepID=UPI000BF2E635|nr:hypothetical protein [Bacillus thuringiensis]PEW37398.1 hypothetical protein CN444_29465 [Bacillus thuringiensis]PFK07392.1 hypothetical protein COJ17_29305 [Bacillus thuringiensis]